MKLRMSKTSVRKIISDAIWLELEKALKKAKHSGAGAPGEQSDREFLEAVLHLQRTGSPWRDLPAQFGKWNTVFKRYSDWVKADVFTQIFNAVSDEPDMEYAMVDATIVKVHRHGHGAKGGQKIKPSASQKAVGRPKSSR